MVSKTLLKSGGIRWQFFVSKMKIVFIRAFKWDIVCFLLHFRRWLKESKSLSEILGVSKLILASVNRRAHFCINIFTFIIELCNWCYYYQCWWVYPHSWWIQRRDWSRYIQVIHTFHFVFERQVVGQKNYEILVSS